MNPHPPDAESPFELIPPGSLLERVAELRRRNARLVQISATRFPGRLELTYSFDLENRLRHLRLELPGEKPRVASITGLFWCAFLYENELHDLFGLEVDGLAVDFHGNLYQTSVKFPFGSTQPPAGPAQP